MNKLYSFVLLAGGVGKRMNREIPKQFLMLGGKPMIIHTLEKVEQISEIDEVVIVCCENYITQLKSYIINYNFSKNYIIIKQGETRQESSFLGVSKCSHDDIIIHEAARPFVKLKDFKKLIIADCENAIFAYDIPFTVVKANSKITGILERDELRNVQLPQKFSKFILLQAFEKATNENKTFTEDASMIFNYFNIEIFVINGNPYNLKITEDIDLKLGEIIYKDYMVGDTNE